MNIPKDCKHKSKFYKDCCLVICESCDIIEHDGCVTNGGCDLVAYNDNTFFLIEIKSGNISSADASKIVEQILNCERYYSQLIGHRKKVRLFIWCVDKRRKRLDDQARTKLNRRNYPIRIVKCQGTINLSNL